MLQFYLLEYSFPPLISLHQNSCNNLNLFLMVLISTTFSKMPIFSYSYDSPLNVATHSYLYQHRLVVTHKETGHILSFQSSAFMMRAHSIILQLNVCLDGRQFKVVAFHGGVLITAATLLPQGDLNYCSFIDIQTASPHMVFP